MVYIFFIFENQRLLPGPSGNSPFCLHLLISDFFLIESGPDFSVNKFGKTLKVLGVRGRGSIGQVVGEVGRVGSGEVHREGPGEVKWEGPRKEGRS